jgi:hypothetical protein
MSLAMTFFCPGPVHPVIWAQWQREFMEEIKDGKDGRS